MSPPCRRDGAPTAPAGTTASCSRKRISSSARFRIAWLSSLTAKRVFDSSHTAFTPPPLKAVDGIGRIVVAMVEDRTVALEAGTRPLRDLVTVVDPARKGRQVGLLLRRIRQQHDAGQAPDQRGVEGVDVHTGHRRRQFHFTDPENHSIACCTACSSPPRATRRA